MADIIKELKLKKKEIEQFRQDKSRQEGQREQLFSQLESECDVDSLVEAEDKIEELTQEKMEYEKLLKELDKELGEIICNAVPGSNSGSVE